MKPRRGEAKAHFVYLIKRADGVIKVGISKNVSRRRSELAHASPEAEEYRRKRASNNDRTLRRALVAPPEDQT